MKKSFFNAYEASTEAARQLQDRVRPFVRSLFEEYGEEYILREIEYLICQETHITAAEVILKRAMDEKKQERDTQ